MKVLLFVRAIVVPSLFVVAFCNTKAYIHISPIAWGEVFRSLSSSTVSVRWVTPTKLIIAGQVQRGQTRFAANLGGMCRLGEANQPRMLKPIAFVAIDVVGMVRLKPHQLTKQCTRARTCQSGFG